MRDFEGRLAANPRSQPKRSISDDVDVDSPRAVALTGPRPDRGLDPLGRLKQFERSEGGCDLDHRVEESGLVLFVHCVRLVDPRTPQAIKGAPDRRRRLAQVSQAVIDVGSQGQEHLDHLAGLPRWTLSVDRNFRLLEQFGPPSAGVAQWLERLTVAQEVAGSIPVSRPIPR